MPLLVLGGGTRAARSTAQVGLRGGAKASMNYQKWTLPAAASISGNIYVCGGSTANPQARVEKYDPAINAWTKRAEMLTPRQNLGGDALLGFLHAVGGATGAGWTSVHERYDPLNDVWTTKASALSTGTYPSQAQALLGLLYHYSYNFFDSYDPGANAWTTRAAPSSANNHRRGALGADPEKQRMYLAGGTDPGWGDSAKLDQYNPYTNTWTTKADLSIARGLLTLRKLGDFLYATGGRNSGGTTYTRHEAYDPQVNTWTTKPDLPATRYEHASATLHGLLYVMGGIRGGGATASVEAYDPGTSSVFYTANKPVFLAASDMRVLMNADKGIQGRILVLEAGERAALVTEGQEGWTSTSPEGQQIAYLAV